MPRFRFIFNPHSGRNRRRPWLEPFLRDWLAASGLDAELYATDEPHHATELARLGVARGCERIVAVGGDGTMNEVAQALVGTPACFALVPCGAGNGLGRHLGIPDRLEQALRIVRDGRVIAIDTGTANGHPFFNAMGAGFDAEIARRFNALPRRHLVGYLRTGWRTFFDYVPATYTLRDAGGWETTLPAFIVAVANSDQYGNNARIAPGARVDDGQLDLVVIPWVRFFGAAAIVLRLFAGNLPHHPRVVHRTATQFTICREAPGVIHVDGETRETGADIEVRVLPRSLRIVVPA